ncbi:ABC transporter substrate-binding protein [Frisingicoccus sp.]|uniref:ABC transporter substrate-binding protein n=1 Tax=Frisingicoccus sp. TaxID=1918627 RepID=UPI002E7A4FFB|nr:ABC transporter substrate-binding protein [Frisingicoccus sp.]MEE0751929.1 ABC transporter substrate-binding protein [Frisingicoccus sp.]
MKRMTKKTLAVALTAAMCLTLAGCGGGDKKETKAAETKAGETTAAAEEGAVDLNALTLDEIIEKAKAEGKVESVGMPDSWANWGLTWQDLKDEYAIDHADTDMSSSEELQMFKTEGENGTKDIGDVGFAFGQQAIDEDLVQGYKTSYWDSVPDWAKAEDGKWMVAYTGATTFLTNTEQVENVPTSWADIKAGDYKVALGDIGGGTAQAAVIASAYAFGGDLNNLDPAFEFWTELAEAGRINTLDILQQNFETGEIAVGVIWSYTAVPYKDQITQYKMEATIPSDGSVMSGYASVINKYAPHPHAAALAREWIFSDAGQANLAKAGAIPTRTDVEIPAEIEEATFAKADYANAIPMEDAEAYAAACETVKTRWEEEILPLLVQ